MSAQRIGPGVRVTTSPFAGLESDKRGRVVRRVCCIYYGENRSGHVCAGHGSLPTYLVREDGTGREFTMPRSYLRTHRDEGGQA